MKQKIKVLLVLLLLFQMAGFAQIAPNKIKVSDDIKLIQLSPKAYVHVSVSEMKGFGKVSSNGLVLDSFGKNSVCRMYGKRNVIQRTWQPFGCRC